jgi:hypothetical protein
MDKVVSDTSVNIWSGFEPRISTSQDLGKYGTFLHGGKAPSHALLFVLIPWVS